MQSRLEEYLDEVSRPLPASERCEWRTEAEQHLTSLVAAYEEMGDSRETATEKAIERFGEANQLGRQMRSESEKSTLPLALKVTAALFGLQGLMCWCLSIPRFLRNGGQNEALLVWGAPALFIAAGLLRRHPFWRRFAIGLLCLTLFFTTPMLFLADRWFVDATPFMKAFRFAAYSAIPAWQLWVLTRPEIKRLFDRGKPKRRFWARR